MQILIATGGDDHTDDALHLGGLVAGTIGAPVTLLTVIGSEREWAQAEAILARAQTLLPAAVAVKTKIRVGQRASQIVLEVAQLEKAGRQVLLVLGERSHRAPRYVPDGDRAGYARLGVACRCPGADGRADA